MLNFSLKAVLVSLLAFSCRCEDVPVEYGVDISAPMHNMKVSNNYAWLPHNVDPENNPTPPEYKDMPIQWLGNVQERYDKTMAGCSIKYPKPKHVCQITEEDRVAMSLRQPQAMQNYTEMGFKKIKTPPEVWKLIQTFWEKNKDQSQAQHENWPKGNTYVNHWDSPTYMMSVENSRLRGGGRVLKQAIWDAARDTIQEWTGEELTECSLYGIRTYTEGAVLATHVDRLPLVSSAIVNVAQDVDEPWPLEVISHDGKAYNVTMEPGDMVLYESHSVLHGRPFPLKGRFYANIFIHFEPVGHSIRHNAKTEKKNVHEEYDKAIKRRAGGHEADHHGLPSYIQEGSVEANKWHARHPDNNRSAKANTHQTGSTAAHQAAMQGDVEGLTEVLDLLEGIVNKKDSNGWTPLHEGARGGHLEVVELLVKNGANLNEKSHRGETPLYWAKKEHGDDHDVVKFLTDLGAISLGPEL